MTSGKFLDRDSGYTPSMKNGCSRSSFLISSSRVWVLLGEREVFWWVLGFLWNWNCWFVA